ncbi:MAG: hypothetical protein U0V49_06260 [Saprospiraceae bacterium]
MKYYFTFCLLLFVSFGIQSQCPTGDLYFSTQEELDSFRLKYPDCTVLAGNVFVRSRVRNLLPLSRIKEIQGDLIFNNNSLLVNMAGLESLKVVGKNLTIINNNVLTDLKGLKGLQEIGGGLQIGTHYNNTTGQQFNSISSLSGLRKIGTYLTVSSNDYLTTLDGLQGLTEIPGSVTISNNLYLNSIEALSGIKRVGDVLSLYNLRVLSNLKGLENLETVGSQLVITAIGELEDLKPLRNLKKIGDKLQINFNSKLKSLQGIDSLDYRSISSLIIRDNILLSQCHVASICNYLRYSEQKPVVVTNNLADCNSSQEITAHCGIVNVLDVDDENVIRLIFNPYNESLSITAKDIFISKVEIIFINTELVYSSSFSSPVSEIEIRVPLLTSGVYIARMMLSDGRVINKKFIKD